MMRGQPSFGLIKTYRHRFYGGGKNELLIVVAALKDESMPRTVIVGLI